MVKIYNHKKLLFLEKKATIKNHYNLQRSIQQGYMAGRRRGRCYSLIEYIDDTV